jgi:UDP-2-acetamido-3-amino-2,3-dideoxy-glucuronate N-acetyltransferase
MAVFEDSRSDRKLMLFNKQIELKAFGFDAAKPEGVPVDIEPAEPLLTECQHFLDCIDEGRPPLTPGEEGLRVLQVLQACQRSLQLNGDPVQVREHHLKVVAI